METQILAALFIVVVLSFIIERALAIVFELPPIDEKIRFVPNPNNPARPRSIKGYIACAASVAICIAYDFDLLKVIFETEEATTDETEDTFVSIGMILTGLVVAGGSQASVKLFQDVLGVTRERRDQLKQLQEQQIAADTAEAKNRSRKASYDQGDIAPGAMSPLIDDSFGRAMHRASEADARRRIDAAEGRVNVDEERKQSAALLRERLRANRKAREATLRRR